MSIKNLADLSWLYDCLNVELRVEFHAVASFSVYIMILSCVYPAFAIYRLVSSLRWTGLRNCCLKIDTDLFIF